MDMSRVKKENKGITFVLTAVNAFSKMAYGVPLLNKSAKTVRDGMEKILDASKALIGKEFVNVSSDHGKEFHNKEVKGLFKERGINFYSTNSPIKCSLVERLNKTLKNMIWRRFLLNSTLEYTNFLDDVLLEYNKRKHSKTGFSPIEASKWKNEKRIFEKSYKTEPSLVTPKFKIGDQVRIAVTSTLFERGYEPKFTSELYTIHDVSRKFPCLYKVRDIDNVVLKPQFYEQEIVKAKNADVFLIEKVLARRKGMMKIRWLGYNSTKDSWIPDSNVVKDN